MSHTHTHTHTMVLKKKKKETEMEERERLPQALVLQPLRGNSKTFLPRWRSGSHSHGISIPIPSCPGGQWNWRANSVVKGRSSPWSSTHNGSSAHYVRGWEGERGSTLGSIPTNGFLSSRCTRSQGQSLTTTKKQFSGKIFASKNFKYHAH